MNSNQNNETNNNANTNKTKEEAKNKKGKSIVWEDKGWTTSSPFKNIKKK